MNTLELHIFLDDLENDRDQIIKQLKIGSDLETSSLYLCLLDEAISITSVELDRKNKKFMKELLRSK